MEEKQTRKAQTIIQEIRSWLETVNGKFRIKDVYDWMPELSKTTAEKRYIYACLSRLISEGLIEKDGAYGTYHRLDNKIERMDFVDTNEHGVDIWLPFNLNNYVEIMPGGIMLIAGEQDSGKTTIALNIAWGNRNKWDVHYFNSELSNQSLKRRTLKFKDTEPYQWAEKISFYSISHGFKDYIEKGSDKLNIIDFMEVSGDEYPFVGQWIREIHDKIIENGAIAIIFLQKPRGREEGFGGQATLEKPRLYLAVKRGGIKIIRAKDWASGINPRELCISFKIYNGSELIPTSDWMKVDKWSL